MSHLLIPIDMCAILPARVGRLKAWRELDNDVVGCVRTTSTVDIAVVANDRACLVSCGKFVRRLLGDGSWSCKSCNREEEGDNG